jgi:hypothetical protein
MKTKEEVKKHLAEKGYTINAMNRIVGFLLGHGMTTIEEELDIKHGEHKWEDFLTWWSSEDKLVVVGDLFCYLAEQYVFAGSKEEMRIKRFIEFLVDEYGEVDNDEDEDSNK